MTGHREQTLSQLLAPLCPIPSGADRRVHDIALDSRLVRPGTLFFAVSGSREHGLRYARDAVGRGAVAVVTDAGEGNGADDLGVPVIEVPRLRAHLGELADRFHGHPSAELDIVGITGTNGKTTCAWLLAAALHELDGPCALIGTLGSGFPGSIEPGALTTPDVFSLHARLRALRDAGARRVCMEVSSHALDQGRADGVRFDVAVFTNLSRDHLDYHGDMDAYGEAKLRLFRSPALRAAVINRDDRFSDRVEAVAEQVPERWTYGRGGDVRARNIRTAESGLAFECELPSRCQPNRLDVGSRLIGRFNVENLLAVITTLLASGQPPASIASQVARLDPAPGRMEVFAAPGLPRIVVDYAHTPDALEKALAGAREHCQGQLWCVFGCGGDRDRGKRPLMGAVAERLADRVIVTDDNPRGESPEAIVGEILAGMQRGAKVVHDRRSAIAAALAGAGADDLILVAGKGHETAQTTGERVVPFSDRAVVREALGIAA